MANVKKQTKANSSKTAKKGLIARIGKFLREVRNELKKVHWPTRKELLAYTAVVLVTVLIVSVYIGIVDGIFARIISMLILR